MRRGGLPCALRSPVWELTKMASAAVPRLSLPSLRVVAVRITASLLVAVRITASLTDRLLTAAELNRNRSITHSQILDVPMHVTEHSKSATAEHFKTGHC